MSAPRLSSFDPSLEDFEAYAERLEAFFLREGTADDKKVAYLITCLNPAEYALLQDLCSPTLPSAFPYGTLKSNMVTHFQSSRNFMTERFKFCRRLQHAGESHSDFLAQLRKMAKYCEFGNTLQERLRDQFVVGLQSEQTQKRLFAEPKAQLTFDRPVELAKSMETAESTTKEVKCANSNNVQKLKSKPKSAKPFTPKPEPKLPPKGQHSGSVVCYRCGSPDHKADACWAKKTTCNYCQITGHLEKVCRKKQKQRFAKQISSADSGSEHLQFNHIHSVSGTSPDMVSVSVNGKPMDMELDIGASISVIVFHAWKKDFSWSPCECWQTGAICLPKNPNSHRGPGYRSCFIQWQNCKIALGPYQ